MGEGPYSYHAASIGLTLYQSVATGDQRGGFADRPFPRPAFIANSTGDDGDIPHPRLHPGLRGPGGHALEMARTALYLRHNRTHHRPGVVFLRQRAFSRPHRTHTHLTGIWYAVVVDQFAGRNAALAP